MRQVSIFPTDQCHFVSVEDLDRYRYWLDDWVNQGGAFWPE